MIPFSKTTIGQEEKEAIAKVIDSGWVVQGPLVKEFEDQFAAYVGSKYAVFVDSGTSALDLVLRRNNGKLRGAKVRVPSLTFTATAEAVINASLPFIFSDVSFDYCLENVDEFSIPVNFGGVKAKEGALVYDSAHRIEKNDLIGLSSTWCYSLYASKNMTTVQGGMIATNNKDDYEWYLLARDHGLNLGTKERYQGSYKQYDVLFVGNRKKADDLRAAVGLEQLKKLPENTEKRNAIVQSYNQAFDQKWTGNHLYPIKVRNNADFMDYMYGQGVQCAVHYRPLHTMTAYQAFSREDLTETEYIASHLVSLPLFPQLTKEEQDFIIRKTKESGMLI